MPGLLIQKSSTEEAQDNSEETPDNPEEAQDNPEETQDSTEETQDSTKETQDNTEETQENPEETQDNTEETKNLLEKLISGIFQVVYRLTGVKISDLHILDLTLEATSDSSAEVKIPITAHINVKLPVLGEIVDLGLNLVLQFSVSVETDEATGVSQVVVAECKNDQHSIELTVLGSHIGVLRQVVNFAVNLANEVLSLVTQSEAGLRRR
nr:short palate, lung and nasal epithelium carcinoma-associated protein 2A-like [Odocoileus virginianus texanus]